MDYREVLTRIGIDLTIFIVEFLAFTLYRKFRSKKIDDPDMKSPAFSESDTSLWTLAKIVWAIPYKEMHTYCGLEGKLYLVLHSILSKGFLLLSISASVILIPIYTYDYSQGFEIENVILQEDKLSVVLIFLVLFTIATLVIVVVYIKQVSEACSYKTEQEEIIQHFTIQVQGLPENNPKELENAIHEFFATKKHGGVHKVYVVPDLSEAYNAKLKIKEATHQISRYEDYNATKGKRKFIRKSLFSNKLDAVEFYESELLKNQNIFEQEYQNGFHRCSGTAFVLFHSPETAYSIVQNFKGDKDKLNSNVWKLSIAPAPGEINWENLRTTSRKTKCMRASLLLFYVIFFFVLVSPLTLLIVISLFLEALEVDEILDDISDAFIPSLALLLYLSGILRHSVRKLVEKSKLMYKSEQTVSAMKKYLLVMVVYTFILPLFGLELLLWRCENTGYSFSESGHYFFFLVTHLAFLKNAGDFIQLPKYIRVKVRQLKALNVKEKLWAYESYEFRWAYEYGISITTYFIVMAFAVANPLILIVGAFFFALRYFTAKYNLLCFYHPVKQTTALQVTKTVVVCLIIGILLFQALTCFIIFEHPLYFGVAVTLFVISVVSFFIIYKKRFRIEAALKKKHWEKKKIDLEDFKKYQHPLEINLII